MLANLLRSLRWLANGSSFQAQDEQSRISVESQRQEFKLFLQAMRKCCGEFFLNRPPMIDELRALEADISSSLPPDCIRSIDCIDVTEKNCPGAQEGQ